MSMEPVAWDETAPSREYVGMLKGEIEAQRVRLSDAEARIAGLEAALLSAKEDADFWRHRSSVWKKRTEEEEARAAAPLPLLKEAAEVLAWIDQNGENQDMNHVDFRVEATSRARSIAAKIGGKDE